METVKILNAFSLNMLPDTDEADMTVFEILASNISSEMVAKELEAKIARDVSVESHVGHAETAAIFSKILGIDVAFNRSTVKLGLYDEAYVGQYCGARLPEGTTSLPEGAAIKWYHIKVRAKW